MEKDVPKRFQNQPAFMKVSMEEAARLHSEGGFNLSINDMKRIFEASDSWIGKHWIPFVSHVYYPYDGANLWFSHDAFWKRYEENAAASIQPHPFSRILIFPHGLRRRSASALLPVRR